MAAYPFQITSYEQYLEDYKQSIHEPETFWSNIASTFHWQKPWETILEWNFNEPKVEWFKGGYLNITENCIDRHLVEKGEQAAIIWEPNDPTLANRTITYNELSIRVQQFANVLLDNNIKKGDRVCIYMGMIPELVIATLACARIGAIHSIIFGGYSAQSIADRIIDAEASMVITCDGSKRGDKTISLKSAVDDALVHCPTVQKVIVYSYTNTPTSMLKGRDIWWDEALATVLAKEQYTCPAEAMESEDPLFILYTSGSTGKPKGVVHSTAGYMIWATYTFVNVFQYQPGQIHFCTADIGWITGHSYIIYGPLCAGATVVMFEGVPTYPDAGRFWEIIDKYNVDIFYTAPTAIRSLMGYDASFIKGKSLESLKVLGSVGEPINEEAWHWYYDNIGKNNVPIVDTWWQTETGGVMISNLAGITPAIPSYATLPLPGVSPILVDENGKEIVENDVNGYLCINRPWPGMIRTTYGDHDRCKQAYFSTYSNLYFTGDGAYRDEHGNYKITGRVDDVLNVSGHRIGTADVENAINMHTGVIESAVVGYPHDVKGQGIYAYVQLNKEYDDINVIKNDILATVSRIIGAIAKPDIIQVVNGLPKTRSGKIMRRILRKIAEQEYSNLGDTSTLLDPEVVNEIIASRKNIK